MSVRPGVTLPGAASIGPTARGIQGSVKGVADLLADLRGELQPYTCVRGPCLTGEGASAVLRIGTDTLVTVTLADGGRATAAADSPEVAPLYVDLDLDALGQVRVRSSDPGFAAGLLAGLDARLRRALAVGGTARLGFGRWQLTRPRCTVALRELAETTAHLAGRPAAIGREWSATARALGATWSGAWSPRGEAAFTIATGAGPVELVHRLDGGDPPRLCTDATLASGARVREPGLVVAPAAVAALVGRVSGEVPALTLPATEPGRIAAMPIADWPGARAPVAAPVPDRIWTSVPTDGADPARGLREELVIDGVEVRTRCDDGLRGTTRVRATAPGSDGLAVKARPGYRFLRGWFGRDQQLGDRGFDDHYLLETSDLPWARWWLGDIERAAIAATLVPEAAYPFELALADASVAFVAAALPSRAGLDAARRAAAFLAARADRAAAEWRTLAAALGATVIGDRFTPDGELVLRTGRGATTVAIHAIRAGGALATRAAIVGASPGGPHLVLRARDAPDGLEATRERRDRTCEAPRGYRGRADDPVWAGARVDAIAAALAIARPDLVELDGAAASLTWSGPMLEPARLAAGVDLLARAVRDVAPAAAPYR